MDMPTRERLVEAARALFWEKGYQATGIAEILRRAEAKSGSLYHFFPTKEDLLRAVLETYRDNFEPWLIRPLFERIDEPVERVFGLLDGYRQGLLQTEFRQGCPIGNLALELAEALPRTRPLLAENFTRWMQVVRDCFAADARLAHCIDPGQLATFVLTTMEGAVMLARTYRTIDPYDASVSQLRDYVERLIADGTDWHHPRPEERSS